MSTSPAPSVTRGDILLQPSYFTSTLYVNPLREDVAQLVQIFAQAYLNQDVSHIDEDIVVQPVIDTPVFPSAGDSIAPKASEQPFAFFKKLWNDYGWSWLHVKVLDGRARESFIKVVLRCFSGIFTRSNFPKATNRHTEYFVDNINPLAQAVALFGMYTFFMTQPSTLGPALYAVKYIPLPLGAWGSQPCFETICN
jgi:hypothetical protein